MRLKIVAAQLDILRRAVKAASDPKRAATMRGFFKTGPGQYGEGDVFVGLTVPQSRDLAKIHSDLPLPELRLLLQSEIHEERLIALLILVIRFAYATPAGKKQICEFYLRNRWYVNNWDLVDVSADKILGAFLEGKPKDLLYKMARSEHLWEKRIAVIATLHEIRKDRFATTLAIVKILLEDEHDLIHKACGWMLREVGKRSTETLRKFLEENLEEMPRTMLRYAIERFPERQRKGFLTRRRR